MVELKSRIFIMPSLQKWNIIRSINFSIYKIRSTWSVIGIVTIYFYLN